MPVTCHRCGKDISDLTFEAGDDIITYRIEGNANMMIVVPTCKECIIEMTEECERYTPNDRLSKNEKG